MIRRSFQKFPDFEIRLFDWVNHSGNTIFYLDSCSSVEAESLGEYELLLGVDSLKVLESDNTLEIDDMLGKGWAFAVFSYNLKEFIHGLRSENSDYMNWPHLMVIHPKHVIALKKSGEVEVWSDQPDELFSEIRSFQTFVDKDFSISFRDCFPSLTRENYLQTVEEIREEIAAGNVYEMNLCIEYALSDCEISSPGNAYLKLRELSPTPFSAFIKIGNKYLISASPERFIRKSDQHIFSQPIKGTIRRGENETEDIENIRYLKNSEKEKAEHVMIVDLVRNDLSKVSESGTIDVRNLFGVYPYAQVHQMISTVSGQLIPGLKFSEILHQTFPMGSMTGAPKKIAMEFIEQFENASRGWYSGSVGYFSPDGNFDFNVVIRSLLYDDEQKKASFSVGGAITYDSDPELEFEESQLKAEAIRKVFGI
ncbi:MAG: aminodeoxychorismate synthase component I [Bacteroidetes bacterium]|nr:aminodeoxychorismate synthase component I [Bacteroidota bacterium]